MNPNFSNIHIYIDGPDRVGKSTVCEMLAKKFYLPIIRMPNTEEILSGNNADREIELASVIYNRTLTQFKQFGFVMDRGFISSVVYSKIFNRTKKLNYIFDVAKELNPYTFILVNSDIETLKHRGEDIIPAEYFEALKNTYIEFAFKYKVICLDVKDLTPQEVFNQIYGCLSGEFTGANILPFAEIKK